MKSCRSIGRFYLYRVFHLKRNHNYCTWTPFRHKTTKPMTTEFLQPYSVVAAYALLEIGTAVISAVLSLDEPFHRYLSPKICYQSGYCRLIRYFPVRIRTVSCFTNSSKRFLCEVDLLFENEHTFCSWIHHVHTCIKFVQMAWAAAWQPGWPWLVSRGRLGESITRRGGGGVDLLQISFLYRSLLLLGYVLNGTPCTMRQMNTADMVWAALVIRYALTPADLKGGGRD
jgi:hypothetical protein